MPNPNGALANLKKLTPEGARIGQRKGVETKLLNKEIRENFKRNAKAFQKVLADIPDMKALDVIRMCVHLALQDNDYETAARWAKELAEYEKPKLQRIEKVNKNEAEELSDDELYKRAQAEGLFPKTKDFVAEMLATGGKKLNL